MFNRFFGSSSNRTTSNSNNNASFDLRWSRAAVVERDTVAIPQTNNPLSNATNSGTKSIKTGGISLKCLLKLRDFVLSIDPSWTTLELCHKLILPITINRQKSFAEILQTFVPLSTMPSTTLRTNAIVNSFIDFFDIEDDNIHQLFSENANICLAYSYSDRFVDIIETLELYYEKNGKSSNIHSPDNLYVWIDVILIYLKNLNDDNWWSSTYLTAIRDVGHTCLITLPWDSPSVLYKILPLWLLYHTKIFKAKLTLCFNYPGRERFEMKIKDDAVSMSKKYMKIIKIESAQSWKMNDISNPDKIWNPSEKAMIFNHLNNTNVSFGNVNDIIRQLIQDWILTEEQNMRRHANMKLSTFQLKNKNNITNNVEELEILDEYFQFGCLYYEQKQLEDSEEMFRKAYNGREKILGDDHQLTLTTGENFAKVLQERGKIDEAVALYEKGLKGCLLALGEQHRDTLSIMNNLGELYVLMERYEEAESLFRTALSGRTRLLGENHQDALTSMVSLGNLLHLMNKMDESEVMLETALIGCEKIFGNDSQFTIITMKNLSKVYKSNNKIESSEIILKKALLYCDQLFGTEHALTLDTAYQLGLVCQHVHKLQVAEELFKKVVEYGNVVMGSDHNIVIDSQDRLGRVLQLRGNFKESEKTIRSLYQMKYLLYGEENDETMKSFFDLGTLLLYSSTSYTIYLRSSSSRISNNLSPTSTTIPVTSESHNNQTHIQAIPVDPIFNESYIILSKTLNYYETRYGKTDLLYLNALNSIGIWYILANQLIEANEALNWVLTVRTRSLGIDHPQTLSVLHNLGQLKMKEGDINAALTYFKQAQIGRESVLGGAHIETLASIFDIATILENLNTTKDLQEAETLYRKALEGREKNYGNHNYTIQALTAFASFLFRRGQTSENNLDQQNIIKLKYFQESELLFRKALIMQEKLTSFNNEYLLEIADQLYIIFIQVDKLEAAEDLYRNVWRSREEILGDSHEKTLFTLTSLAQLMQKRMKNEDANDLFRKIITRKSKLFGLEHFETLNSQSDYALHLIGLSKNDNKIDYNISKYDKKMQESLDLLMKVYEGRLKLFGEENKDTLGTMFHLGLLYKLMKKIQEGIDILYKCVNGCVSVHGGQAMETFNAKNSLANLLHAKGSREEADRLYREVLDGRVILFGKNHVDTLTTMGYLANLCHLNENHNESEMLYRETIAQRELLLGVDHPDTLRTLNNFAALLQDMKKLSESESTYRKTLKIRENTLGMFHVDTLRTRHNLGVLLIEMNQLEQAEILLRKAVAGNNDVDVLEAMHYYGKMLVTDKKLDFAEKTFRKTVQIRKQVLGENKKETLESCLELASLLRYRNKSEEAESILRATITGFKELYQTPYNESVLNASYHLALLLAKNNQCYNQAEELLLDIIKGYNILYNNENNNTSVNLDNNRIIKLLSSLGTLYFQQMNEWKKAENIYKQLLTMKESSLGADHAEVIDIVYILGTLLYNQQDYITAQDHFSRVLAYRSATLTDEHPLKLTCLVDLAKTVVIRLTINSLIRGSYDSIVVADMGLLSQAEEIYRRVLGRRESRVGTNNVDTLTSAYWLGVVLLQQVVEGRINDENNEYLIEADELLTRVMQSREKLFGKKHTETLLSINQLGKVLSQQAKYQEAEMLFRSIDLLENGTLLPTSIIEQIDILVSFGQLLELSSKVNPIPIINYYDSEESVLDDLAVISTNNKPSENRLSEAESIYTKALSLSISNNPLNHIQTQQIMKILGLFYINKRNMMNEGKEILHRLLLVNQLKVDELMKPECKDLLEVTCKLPHENQLLIYEVCSILGLQSYKSLQSLEKGSSQYIETLNGIESLFLFTSNGYKQLLLSDNDILSLNALYNIALVEHAKGNINETMTLYRKVLSGKEHLLQENHPDIVACIIKLANLLFSMDELIEAQELFRKALARIEILYGPYHILTLITLRKIGNILHKKGIMDECIDIYTRALSRSDHSIKSKAINLEILSLSSDLGTAYEHLANYGESEDYLRRALIGREQLLGSSHLDTITSIFKLGCLLQAVSRLNEAEECYRDVLIKRKALLGNDHIDTIDVMNNLGMVLQYKGSNNEAEEMYLLALKGREKSYGPSHILTGNTANNLGLLYQSMSKVKDSEEMFTRALSIRSVHLSDFHPDTVRTLANLGNLLHVQGRLIEAESIYRRALAGREKLLGLNHADTLVMVSNLGALLQLRGQYEESQKLYRRALSGRDHILGPTHPSTLTSTYNLATLLHQLGQYDEAELMYRKALIGREKVFGKDNLVTIQTATSLLKLLREAKKRSEIIMILRSQILWKEEVLGETHADVLTDLLELANELNNNGDYNEAESKYRSYLDRCSILGTDATVSFAEALASLAFICENNAKLNEAEEHYRRALTIYEELKDNKNKIISLGIIHVTTKLADLLSHPTIKKYDDAQVLYRQLLSSISKGAIHDNEDEIIARFHLAKCIINSTNGDLVEAESLLTQALLMTIAGTGNDDKSQNNYNNSNNHNNNDLTMNIKSELGSLLITLNKLNEAEEILLQVLAVRENSIDNSQVDTLATINHIIRLYQQQSAVQGVVQNQNLEEIEKYYRKALRIREKSLGFNHIETIRNVHNLASVLQTLRKLEEAEVMYRRALVGREKLLGLVHVDTISSMLNLGSTLLLRGSDKQMEEAQQWYIKVMMARQQGLGEEHVDTLHAIHSLGTIYFAKDEFALAQDFYKKAFEGRKKLLGEGHPDTLTSQHHLGLVMHIIEKYDDAIINLKATLAGRDLLMNNSNSSNIQYAVDYYSTMYHLAESLFAKYGPTEEVENYYRKALAERNKLVGNTHHDSLVNAFHLAKLLLTKNNNLQSNEGNSQQSNNNRKETEELLRFVLTTRVANLGDNDSETIETKLLLAEMLDESSKDKIGLYESVLSYKESTLGTSHLDTLALVKPLSLLYQKAGKHEAAEKLLLKSIDNNNNNSNNNGNNNSNNNKAAQRKSRNTIVGMLDGEPYDTAGVVMEQLGSVYLQQYKINDAIEAYTRVISEREYYREALKSLVSNPNPPSFVDNASDTVVLSNNISIKNHELIQSMKSMEILAGLYHMIGSYDDAKALFQEVLSYYEIFFGAEHNETIQIMFSFGLMLKDNHEYEQALLMMNRVYNNRLQSLTLNHQLTLQALSQLASLYHLQGVHDRALNTFSQVLPLQSSLLDETHVDVLDTIDRLSSLEITMKEYQKAQEKLRKNIIIKKNIFGNKHFLTSFSIKLLLQLLLIQSKNDEEKTTQNGNGKSDCTQEISELSLELIEIYEISFGSLHPRTIESTFALGDHERRRYDFVKAEEVYTRALTSLSQTNNPNSNILINNDDFVLRCLDSLGEVCFYLKKFNQSETHYRRAVSIRQGSNRSQIRSLINLAAMDLRFALADLLMMKGDYEEAGVLYSKVMASREKSLPSDHRDMIYVILTIALQEYQMGKIEESKSKLYNIINILKQKAGTPSNGDFEETYCFLIFAQLFLSIILLSIGKLNETESLLLDCDIKSRTLHTIPTMRDTTLYLKINALPHMINYQL
eukprot:gene7805-10600_t